MTRPHPIYLWLLLVTGPLFAEGWVLIAHPELNVDQLNTTELKEMVLGQKTSWPGGKKISLSLPKRGVGKEQFLQQVMKKTPRQFSIYWKRIIFTGKRLPFKEFREEQELVDYVATTKGALGVCSTGNRSAEVKTIEVAE